MTTTSDYDMATEYFTKMKAAIREADQLREQVRVLEGQTERLMVAASGLVAYRKRNTLNFQLEKADYFINLLADALDALAEARKALREE